MRCGIYARKSQVDEKDTSLDTQINFCRNLITQFDILNETKIYSEDNVSGMWADRPEFEKMINDVKSHKIDVIVVYKWDRFSRNTEHCLKFTQEIRSYGGYILSGDSTLDVTTCEGHFAQTIMWATSEYHARLSAQRTLDTMENIVSHTNRHITGIAPYGYEKNSRGELVINIEESVVVHEIYQKFLGGSTIGSIVRKLNDMSKKTRKGNAFTKQYIKYILTNPIYKGTYIYNRINGKKKKHRLVLNDGHEIIKEKNHICIVSEDEFNKVQKILNNKSDVRTNDSGHIYMLRGIIKCSCCGKALVGSSQTSGRSKSKRYYYQCPDHKLKLCLTKPINADYIEKYVSNIVIEILKNNDISYEFDNNVLVQKKFLENSLKENNLKLKKINNKFNALVVKSMENLPEVTLKAVNDNIVKLSQEISNIQNANTKLINDINSLINATSSYNLKYDDFLSNREIGRGIISNIIKDITCDSDEIIINTII